MWSEDFLVITIASLGFIAPLFWIIWKLCSKKIIAYLAEYINDDFDKYGILFPASLVLILPFLLPIFATKIEKLGDLIKFLFPVSTFLMGQYIARKQSERDKYIKDIALRQRIASELERNLNIIDRNLYSLEIHSNQLEPLYLVWWEQSNLYFELYFSDNTTCRKDDVNVSLKIEISKIFNNILVELDTKIKMFNKINADLKSEFSSPNSKLTVHNLFDSLVSSLEVWDMHKCCKLEIQQLMQEVARLSA
ncbi:hypothetical protein A6S26_02770 [Nostoc sp. ATCC 43529]|nr:hypothetical protein A6S26_02770 [Nostoc sp. ATCC 43529]